MFQRDVDTSAHKVIELHAQWWTNNFYFVMFFRWILKRISLKYDWKKNHESKMEFNLWLNGECGPFSLYFYFLIRWRHSCVRINFERDRMRYTKKTNIWSALKSLAILISIVKKMYFFQQWKMLVATVQ